MSSGEAVLTHVPESPFVDLCASFSCQGDRSCGKCIRIGSIGEAFHVRALLVLDLLSLKKGDPFSVAGILRNR